MKLILSPALAPNLHTVKPSCAINARSSFTTLVPQEEWRDAEPEERRDAEPEERRDVEPEERRDVEPEERRDVEPEERRDVEPEERRDVEAEDEEDDSEKQLYKDRNKETPTTTDEGHGRTRYVPGGAWLSEV
ncbi:hypothetical protein NDU88_008185 [Pleurodeles waltl]|uniref:Uncharacterized protein n=1 Tax=Pleurodeles waltl TaxID=8319 RepID=A0AAV7NYK6_PLEWA|nr:hypothetical protein NDU88_008185 [Pleurodeles waltl]